MTVKKLAYGLGDSGEENMCGHESSPTLHERQERHKVEIQTLNECKYKLEHIGGDGLQINSENRDTLKSALIVSMSHMSGRVKELRKEN